MSNTSKQVNVQLLKDYIENEQSKRRTKKQQRNQTTKQSTQNYDDLISMLVNQHLSSQQQQQESQVINDSDHTFKQHRQEYIKQVREHVLPNTNV
jgi:alpha/beta superfamily hydrolase